jgi:site-specific recombinase XerD
MEGVHPLPGDPPTPPHSFPALPSGTPTAWEEAIYAFLVEKRSRSGSTRTVESYARMLWLFFRMTTPDQVRSADVLAYTHGIGASGRVPSSTTVGARIACLSSFYRFTIRMGLLTANPCDALERPRTIQSVARGDSADEVRRLLSVVPGTIRGRRDRAILLVLILTGRRRAEVIGLRAGDLSLEGEIIFCSYRGRGGKRGRRELPRPAHEAILRTLADAGKDRTNPRPDRQTGLRPPPALLGLRALPVWRCRPLPPPRPDLFGLPGGTTESATHPWPPR